MEWIDAAGADDIEDDECLGVELAGTPIVLVRAGGEWFALHDECPHGLARLSDGYVEHGCIECPLHQGLIDLRTGDPKSAPIIERTRTYPVRLVEGRVEVAVG